MTSTHGHRRLVTAFLGMLLAQSMVASAQNPDPEDKQQIIEAIRFEGGKDLNEEELRSKLRLKEKGIYNEEIQLSDETIIKRSLWDQGYVYADIHKVRTEPGDGDRLIVVFVIDAGDIYRVSEVKLTGIQAFNAQEVAPTTNVTAGKLYSHSSILADEKMIRDFYGARGYPDMLVHTSVREAGRDSVRIDYMITEGEKFLLQAIQVSGNVRIKEEAIRKRFKLASGDVLNMSLIEQGREALRRTGVFESVDVIIRHSAKPGFRELVVTVVEK